MVINIEDETYERLKNSEILVSGLRSGKHFLSKVCMAVANGVELPKGHGDLVDIDKVFERMKVTKNYDILVALTRVNPIIKADKKE